MKLREWLQQYNLQLNQSQLSAMLDEHPSSLLLAVPGSGKTTLILAKCAYLITKGIPANQILVITFSKEGANELKQRFLSTYRNLSSPNFRTIHSLCYLILKQYNPTGIFTLHQNLRPLLRQLYIKNYQQFPQEVDLNEVQRLITYIRNKYLSEEEMQTINFNNQPFKPFYDTYQQIKISKKIMDFDDLLYYAYHALLKKSDLLKSFRSQIQWLMVDEAQDTSILQHNIIQLLHHQNHLFMVGDEDQSIYRFRAAEPQALLDFEKTYPDAQILKMETNYRSHISILQGAMRIIQTNTQRYEKNIIPSTNEKGILQFKSYASIQDHQQQFLSQLSQGNHALLFRNNDSALYYIDYFLQQKIPIHLQIEMENIFTHPIILDFIAFFQLLKHPDDTEALLKIYSKLNCGLSRSQIEEACTKISNHEVKDCFKAIQSNNSSFIKVKNEWKRLRKMTPYLALLNFIENIYIKYLQANKIEARSKCIGMLAIAQHSQTIDEFFENFQRCKEIQSDNDASITLSTIHRSKGQEFDHVHLIDAYQGILPSCEMEDEDWEEEVRLFYVAVTRAKKSVTYHQIKQSYCFKNYISPFAKTFFNFKDNKKTAKTSKSTAFKKKMMITHKTFGEGVILDIEENFALIQFADKKRKINLDFIKKTNSSA